MEYEIIKLEIKDFDILIPLMKDCFGMDVDVNYFKWKYLENPSGFVEGFYAKCKDGSVAAFYGVIPEMFEINGVKKNIYQSCDTMTHSSHRRKGLFQKLALHCYNYLEKKGDLIIYGFGGGKSTPGFIKFGWKELFKIKYFFYPSFLKYFEIKDTKDVFEVEKLEYIEKLINYPIKNIGSIKNIDNYKWRISNPLNRYKIIAFNNSYLVYYKKNKKIFIFDYNFMDKQSSKKLLNYLKKECTIFNKGIIAFMQESTSKALFLKNNFFISNPFNRGPLSEKTPFIIYSNIKEDYIFNKDNWCINSYDNDAL